VPIHIKLAQEFALFDQYHTSFPGPSTPNHLFLMTGTNAGCTSTGQDFKCASGGKFPQKTIFESLADSGHSWRYYYNDSSWNYFLKFFSTPEGAAGTVNYDEFYDRAAKGTLPAFSFVLPRQGGNATTGEGANDDHPCHDIRLGEKLIKETYEALRAGPGWNKTLLLITYDDTGGWYDHQDVPTKGIPRPDDEYSSCGRTVDTNWLGMRAPTLLVSPWVSKGKVIHDPEGPTPTSKYEHTSLLSAIKTIFDLPAFLSRRDKWAGDFSKELDLAAPRTDCPMHLPQPPTDAEMDAITRSLLASRHATHLSTGSGGPASDPAGKEFTHRQRRRIEGLARIIDLPPPNLQTITHAKAEEWIQRAEASHRRKSRRRDEL